MRAQLKNVKIEEWVALGIAISASILNIAVYKNNPSLKETLLYMGRYFTFGDPFYALFYVFIYIFYSYRRLTLAVIERVLYKKPFPRVSAKSAFFSLVMPFRVIAPLVVAGLPMYTLLGNFNNHLRFFVKDVLLFKADIFLFGSAPFIWLANTFSSPLFTEIFKYGYFSLGIIMSAALALLFFFSQYPRKKTNPLLFRELILSFIISLVVAYPFFYFIPCNDPSNYFVQNVGRNTFSEDAKKALANYHPSKITEDIMKQIADAETGKGKYSPSISCFPSMHATLSSIALYFLYALTPWSLIFTIPWATFLLAGGLYFAQHYFVDYLVAIPVVMASIFIAKALLEWENKKKKKKPFTGFN